MVEVPDSTKSSLGAEAVRAKQRWPALSAVTVKHRAGFAYITGHTTTVGTVPAVPAPLHRLRLNHTPDEPTGLTH
jgi:hypothetical protein